MRYFIIACTSVVALWIACTSQAQSESPAPLAANTAQPATDAELKRNSNSVATQQELAEPEQIALLFAAWARPLAGDLSGSSHDVDRALGFGLLRSLAITDAARSMRSEISADQSNPTERASALDDAARSELLAPRTSAAAKMLYLGVVCALPETKTCAEILAMNPMQNKEANNAFVVIALFGHQARVAQGARQTNEIQPPDRNNREATKEFYHSLRKKSEADEKALTEHFKRELSIALRWDDFGLIYKDRIRRALKSRPLPDALLARLGPQFSMIAKFFPQEDLAAEIAGNAAVMVSNSAISGYKLRDEALKAPMQRVANMIMSNPKSSMVSMSAAARFIENHPLIKRLGSYKDIDKSKVISAELLITTEWIGLRPVLVKAITQGDVAALDDLFAWADRAVAKIPDKTASQLEQEAAEQKATQARWKAANEVSVKALTEIKQACTQQSIALTAEGIIKSDKQAKALLETCIEKGNADVFRAQLETAMPKPTPVPTNKPAIDVRYDAKATDAQLKELNTRIQAQAAHRPEIEQTDSN